MFIVQIKQNKIPLEDYLKSHKKSINGDTAFKKNYPKAYLFPYPLKIEIMRNLEIVNSNNCKSNKSKRHTTSRCYKCYTFFK